MKGKTHRHLRGLVLLSLLSTYVVVTNLVFAQAAFPEGKGRETVFVACTQCHGLDRLTRRVKLNAAEWENALYDMMARGAVVDIKDLADVRNYLVSNLAVEK
jgi:hypothetical protein